MSKKSGKHDDIMPALQKNKDLILSLLKGAPAGLLVSEVLAGLRNRAVQICYVELEDWLHDQKEVELAEGGRFRLTYSTPLPQLKKRRVIPELGESLSDTDATAALPRLIDYYINCIREEGKKVYSYRGNQGGSFITLDGEMLSGGQRFVAVSREKEAAFLKNTSQRAVFYGYPLYLEWIESRDGEFCDYKVTPVFIIRMDSQEEPTRAIFQPATGQVRLNPELLAKLKWRDRSHFERVLGAPDEQYSCFAERVALAVTELSELGVIGNLDPATIARAQNLATLEEKKPGLYNVCGLFATGADPYNQRLLKELSEIRDFPAARVNQTSLAALLRTKTVNASGRIDPSEDFCAFPGIGKDLLNAVQSTAVKESFNYPISVVTGPPGSGKSEVVSALIITAVLNGMSVLFASRNNKAVEVVKTRLDELSQRRYGLMRVGGQYDKDSLDILDKLEALPIKEGSMSFNQLWRVCLDLIDDQIAKEREVKEWANLIDRQGVVTEAFETLRRKYMRGISDTEEKLGLVNLDPVIDAYKVLNPISAASRRGAKVRAWLKFRLGAKKGRVLLSALKEELDHAGLNVPCDWPANVKEVGEVSRDLGLVVDLLDTYAETQALNEIIAKKTPLDEVLMQAADARTKLSEQVPRLLAAKVKENASGGDATDASDDALARFRENLKKLTKSNLLLEERESREAIQAQGFGDVLNRLPAWAVTNLSVGGRIPLDTGIFDLVIIDEASQCDIASSLPLLVRSKRAVVIGDPLQLSQISNISKVAEQQFLVEHDLNHDAFDHLTYSQKSIYDAARHVTPRESYSFLSNHYRCSEDIIQFANSAHWYDETLEVFTNERTLERPEWWKKGIIWNDVESRYSGGGKYLLREEIDRAVELVKELEKRNYEGTVGVVCPFRDMTDRIRDAVCAGDISKHFLDGANFEAQTAHGFQGDARDVIIYVMGVHPDMPRGKKWFISDENSNLFNVALSRAKASFVVVGSRRAAAAVQHNNAPISYLKDFVSYVDSLEAGEETPQPDNADPVFAPEQIWEEKFYCGALKPAGLDVYSQHKVGPYKLDFALFHGDRKLDIEVDGERWHKDAAGNRLEKDIDRNIYVKSQGWDVMRFWVYELKEDMEKCLKKIENWMNSNS